MPSKGQLTTPEKFAAQLLALGKSLTFAAEQAGLTLPHLRKRLTLPLMQQEIDRWRGQHFASLSESMGARLNELQHPALEAMNALITAESEPVRLGAAKDLLDRGPLSRRIHGDPHGGSTQGSASITLDQAALTAILAGAINIGHAGILTAFAALHQSTATQCVPQQADWKDTRSPKDVTPGEPLSQSSQSLASSEFTTLNGTPPCAP